MFKYTEWTAKPSAVKKITGSRYIVTRNVAEGTDPDGNAIWKGESAIMSEEAYAAYSAAESVAIKREQEIADETVLALIEEGSL